jgi:hypothetical protein
MVLYNNNNNNNIDNIDEKKCLHLYKSFRLVFFFKKTIEYYKERSANTLGRILYTLNYIL